MSDKIKVIRSLLGRVNALLIGGAMAYTFLAPRAAGRRNPWSRKAYPDSPKSYSRGAQARASISSLPVDHVDMARAAALPPGTVREIPAGRSRLDVGPETVKRFPGCGRQREAVFWNGPLGVFQKYRRSMARPMPIAAAVAETAMPRRRLAAESSVAAVPMRSGRAGDITHISTGGGASFKSSSSRREPLPWSSRALEGAHTSSRASRDSSNVVHTIQSDGTRRRTPLGGSEFRVVRVESVAVERLKESAERTRVPLLAGNWKDARLQIGGRSRSATPSVKRRCAGGWLIARGSSVSASPFLAAWLASPNARREAACCWLARASTGRTKVRFTRRGFRGPMLTAAGCTHVIVGHSERRQLSGDTGRVRSRAKSPAALRKPYRLTPIAWSSARACRSAKPTRPGAVIDRQMRAALCGSTQASRRQADRRL